MSLTMTTTEVKTIDSNVEQMLDWAKTRQAEAEQLSLDAVRLLSCTGDRLEKTRNQGFFKRCWSRFSGEAAAAERANTGDLIQMQKISLRYINMLQEQQLMMAHAMLSLKNNLYSLAVKEEETRNLVALLAKHTLERFEKLEHRVDQLEISANLQGWLLSLEERDYDEKFPTEYMRLFRVINDFYSIKNDEWNYNDLMFMRKAIRTVGIDPKRKLSLNIFIDSLTDEIQQDSVGFDSYGQAITMFNPQNMDNYSNFAVEHISSPVFTSIHGLKIQYMDRLDVVEELSSEMQISSSDALKRLLRRSIANLGVDLDYQFPLAETAIEILGCIRLAEKLAVPQEALPQMKGAAIEEASAKSAQKKRHTEEIKQPVTTKEAPNKVDASNLTMSSWKTAKIILKITESRQIGGSNLGSFAPYVGLINSGIKASGLLFGGMLSRNSNSLTYTNNGFFFLCKEGILYSSDLNKWEKKYDKISSGSILNVNDQLFNIKHDSISSSGDGNIWNDIDLPTQYSGQDIWYKNIYYNGKEWFFCGQHDAEYNYTKKRFLKNSTEASTYSSHVIFTGENFSNFRAYSFTQDFPMYEVLGVVYCDNILIALLRNEDDSDDVRIAISKNGFSWKSFDIGDDDMTYHGIFSHGNRCFIDSNSYIFEFSQKTGKLKDANQKFPCTLDKIYSYPEYNIAFYYNNKTSSHQNDKDCGVFITNDFKKWERIDNAPKNICGLIYAKKQLVLVCESGEIAYRDLY